MPTHRTDAGNTLLLFVQDQTITAFFLLQEEIQSLAGALILQR